MTTLPARQSTSGATGPQRLDGLVSSAIGTLLGGRGASSGRSSDSNALGFARRPPLTASQVADLDPDLTDRVASLPAPLTSWLAVAAYRDVYGPGGWDGYAAQLTVRHPVPPGVAELARARHAAYGSISAPLEPEDAIRELLATRVLCVRRSEDQTDWELTLDAWLNQLEHYPADIAMWGLRFWARNEKFWPSWAELKRLLDHKLERRKALVDALHEMAYGKPPQREVAA